MTTNSGGYDRTRRRKEDGAGVVELWSTLLDEVRPAAALVAAPLMLLRLPVDAVACLAAAVQAGGGADGRPWYSLHLINSVAGAAVVVTAAVAFAAADPGQVVDAAAVEPADHPASCVCSKLESRLGADAEGPHARRR